MYRTSTQEPRYKHSSYEREPRHVESREFSEEFTSSSEEEEDSSGKYTEESDEETTESQESNSLQKRNESSPAFEQQWSYNKFEKTGKNITNPYVCDTRIYKQDKVTQKNLLSPFPSFLIPPIPRQVTGPTHNRLPNTRSPKEEQNNLKNAIKNAPKKNNYYREEKGMTCVSHRNQDYKERKGSQNLKIQVDQANQSKVCSSDRVLKCLHRETPEVSSRNFSKSTAETEKSPKQSTFLTKYIRRPKSSTRQKTKNQQTMTKFADCSVEHETRVKSRPKTAIGVIPCEKDANIREAFLARNIGDGKLPNKKGGEVKEKLVYVVEEEGKEVTKLETDLFTLNEILAIKRDLLELSEFAKKLKKLKEMKKESENMKNKENTCQCKPAEELLKNVNRRIEILEARQEELEKENSRSEQKGDIETESKNFNITKMSSDSQSKTPAMIQSSVTTAIPSLPKTEIFATRPEGFSNNSDIIKELVDIKTQLQRLEKRRISKEVSNEVVPEGSTKLTANKNRAIAVFSSKTYIFATENFEKKKMGEKIKKEEKGKNYVASEQNTTKSEQRKANVASWLKNVKIKQMETDVSMFLSTQKLKKKENDLEEPKGNANVKCKNCVQAFKGKDFENQEPQKNRALETNERESGNSFAKLIKNESSVSEISRYVEYNKCMMTPSGRLFALMSQSNEKVLNISSACKLKPPPGANSKWLPSRDSRSGSNESITSAILAKQQVQRLKAQTLHAESANISDKLCNRMILCPSQSRSIQELNFCEVEKIARNLNAKNFERTEIAPFPKDKNKFVKHLEAHLMMLKKNFEKRDTTTSSGTYSEFLASINLDSKETFAAVESSTLQKNIASNEVHAYMASTKTNLKALDLKSRSEEKCKESKKNKEKKQYQREKGKKEKNESELKKNSKSKMEKKCKEPTKQKKCKKKKKKKPHRCKCKNASYSNFWKNYHREDCFKYNEKKSLSNHSKIPSEDNLKIYEERQKRGSKTNLESKKPVVDSFTIRNIFKNFGRYYPKISNFHLFSVPRGEFYDRKQEEYAKSKHSKARIANKSEEQKDEDEDHYYNKDDENCNQTSESSYFSQSLSSNKLSDRGDYLYYDQTAKPNDLRKCRCVQVYLQTQVQRGWSGLGPFQAFSVESMTNESTSRLTKSCKSLKSETVFPVQKSQIQCVGHSTHEKKKLKCCKKCKKKKKHKQKGRNVCVCPKCGHTHKLKKKKRKKCKCACSKKARSETSSATRKGSDPEFLKQCVCGEKPPNETFPLFSFFSNFCKVKPRESKFSKSIANKFSEIRQLKTCPRIKTNFFSKWRNHMPTSHDQKSQSKHKCCSCASRLLDIENKLKKLEKNKSYDFHCKKYERKKRKEKEKNKKKKRNKKQEKECHCVDSLVSSCCHSEDCLCCNDEKKKDVEKHKKKKDKKDKAKCCCCESNEDAQKGEKAYYCTVEDRPLDIAPRAFTYKTREKKKEKFPRVLKPKDLTEQTSTRLKEKLPIPTSFWENVQNYNVIESQGGLKNLAKIKNKKPADLFEPGIIFLDDCCKRNSRARKSQGYEMKEVPMTFLKKSNKSKKSEKGDERKEKKKKKTLKSKNRSQKLRRCCPDVSF